MPDIASSQLTVPSDLQDAGRTLNQKAGEIDDELVRLKSQLTPLAETWIGPAASYYQPLQQEWNIAADGLFGPTGVLGQIAQALNLTWNNYTDCEWSNVKGWQQ